MTFAYIPTGLGIGAIVLIFVIGGIVLFSLGYIGWMKIKRFFRRGK
jgi:hypothetical protein